MAFSMRRFVAAGSMLIAAPVLAADDDGMIVAGKHLSTAQALARMMSGEPLLDQPDLDAAIARAEQSPLGSDANPVRVAGPDGERAYLARLRCADGHAPAFSRIGNVGPGIYYSIVDDYAVDCGKASPGRVHVKMDMYFRGHVEDRAVAGFTMAPTAETTPG